MEFEKIIQLIDHVSASKLTSFHYEDGDLRLSMKCGQVPKVVKRCEEAVTRGIPDMVSAPSIRNGEAEETEIQGNLVKSPLVGTFYAAPAEDAQPFVKVGDHVKKGQVLAIVEAMKLMNEIESDFDGEVAEIYVENGQPVEYGMPLFRVV